jgi:hypothetical protein
VGLYLVYVIGPVDPPALGCAEANEADEVPDVPFGRLS